MALVFLDTYLVDGNLGATGADNGQTGLGACGAGGELPAELLPSLAFYSDGGLGDGLALLVDELNNQQLVALGTVLGLDGGNVSQGYLQVVFGTIGHINGAANTLVVECVAADNGIMWIVGTYGVNMCYYNWLAAIPSGSGIGAALNAWVKFEITVLDKLLCMGCCGRKNHHKQQVEVFNIHHIAKKVMYLFNVQTQHGEVVAWIGSVAMAFHLAVHRLDHILRAHVAGALNNVKQQLFAKLNQLGVLGLV